MQRHLRVKVGTALTIIAIWITFGTIVFQYLESWTWVQSFYFAVITFTTVGYGDLSPTTDLSRLFTAFYVLFGAAIALGSLGLIGKHYVSITETKIFDRIEDKFRKK